MFRRITHWKFIVHSPLRNQNNYRISEADRLGVGSPKAKCKANLEAIELLKITECQSFPAEHDTKQTLVRYVGWGGLPQVFDSLNESWKVEREKLEKLLTPAELDSARATTLNAHYTAPVVISATISLSSRNCGGLAALNPRAPLSRSARRFPAAFAPWTGSLKPRVSSSIWK